MIRTGMDSETLERVQLDDYDDYLLDDINKGIDVTMTIETPEDAKTVAPDDAPKEYHKLANAKRTKHRRRTHHMDQQGEGNLHDSSTGNLRTIINIGRDACNVIITRQKEREEIEAYNPTHYQISLDYLETTCKRKPDVGECSTQKEAEDPQSGGMT